MMPKDNLHETEPCQRIRKTPLAVIFKSSSLSAHEGRCRGSGLLPSQPLQGGRFNACFGEGGHTAKSETALRELGIFLNSVARYDSQTGIERASRQIPRLALHDVVKDREHRPVSHDQSHINYAI